MWVTKALCWERRLSAKKEDGAPRAPSPRGPVASENAAGGWALWNEAPTPCLFYELGVA